MSAFKRQKKNFSVERLQFVAAMRRQPLSNNIILSTNVVRSYLLELDFQQQLKLYSLNAPTISRKVQNLHIQFEVQRFSFNSPWWSLFFLFLIHLKFFSKLKFYSVSIKKNYKNLLSNIFSYATFVNVHFFRNNFRECK